MRAQEALEQAGDRRISAETPHGVVVIYHHRAGAGAPEVFTLSFIPRDTHGHLNAGGVVRAGDYGELRAALAAAAEKYGTGEDGWEAADGEFLRGQEVAYHFPPLTEGDGSTAERARRGE